MVHLVAQAGKYRLLSDQDPRRQSHSQLEAHVHYASIISHPAEGPVLLAFPEPFEGLLRVISLTQSRFVNSEKRDSVLIEEIVSVGMKPLRLTLQESGRSWRPSASSALTSSAPAARCSFEVPCLSACPSTMHAPVKQVITCSLDIRGFGSHARRAAWLALGAWTALLLESAG